MKNNALMRYLDCLTDENINHFLYKVLGENNSADEICIWGAGQRGMKIYYHLQNMHIDVMCFCDSDSDKYGYIAEHHYCIPVEYLQMDKEHVLVIVANARHKDVIIGMLIEKGFKYIVTDSYLYEKGLIIENLSTYKMEPCDNQMLSRLADCYNQVMFDMLKREEVREII